VVAAGYSVQYTVAVIIGPSVVRHNAISTRCQSNAARFCPTPSSLSANNILSITIRYILSQHKDVVRRMRFYCSRRGVGQTARRPPAAAAVARLFDFR